MSTCTVCLHPARGAIEETLRAAAKLPWRALAQQYAVDHLALMNHKRWHMTEAKPATWHESITRQPDAIIKPLMTPDDEMSIPASMAFYTMRARVESDEDAQSEDACLCYWCGMSKYQRLLQAWNEANTADKEKFCAYTRTMDVPF